MRILGVDPGGTGALALIEPDGMSVRVEDVPTLKVSRGRGQKTEIDVWTLAGVLEEWAPDACYFERVHGQEGDGVSAAFNFGRAAGAVEALVKARGARFVFVAPFKWKKEMGLVGKAKDDSRALAMSLWPSEAESFRLKKHDGRADAALIAEYGRRDMRDKGIFG